MPLHLNSVTAVDPYATECHYFALALRASRTSHTRPSSAFSEP